MSMLIFKPATGARFEDVRTILGPKREGAQGCWCLSVRLGPEEDAELRGEARAEAVAKLCRRRAHAPGVLAYDDGGKVDRTLASVGTRRMFEQAGFTIDGHLDGSRDGFRQAVMRRSF